ncbi:hypothetical protein Dimus_026184, partial [Dionaea muscipula]
KRHHSGRGGNASYDGRAYRGIRGEDRGGDRDGGLSASGIWRVGSVSRGSVVCEVDIKGFDSSVF